MFNIMHLFFCCHEFITKLLILQYLREVTRLVTGETKQKLSKRLVNFAKEWMAFVTEKCEKGRGMRPK